MPRVGGWHCEPWSQMCGHAITYWYVLFTATLNLTVSIILHYFMYSVLILPWTQFLQLHFNQSTSLRRSSHSLSKHLTSLKRFHRNSLKAWVMSSLHYGWVISLFCLEQATSLKLLNLSEVLSVNSVWAFVMENYIILGEGIDGSNFLSMDKDLLESLSLSTDTQQTLMNIINDMVHNG